MIPTVPTTISGTRLSGLKRRNAKYRQTAGAKTPKEQMRVLSRDAGFAIRFANRRINVTEIKSRLDKIISPDFSITVLGETSGIPPA
jgi:hypothetical protein